MPIDTERAYDPRLDHPLYCKIVPDTHNDYTVFSEYEIRIPDEEHGGEGPYNYVFNAVLVGKELATWAKIPGLLKGYVAKERDAEEALKTIHPEGDAGGFDDDEKLGVLFFLRIDETKKFITSEHDILLAQHGDIQ